MKPHTTAILKLIELIYEAAPQPELWPEFAHLLGRVIPAHEAMLHTVDAHSGQVSVLFTMQAPETVRRYFARYHATNPYLPHDWSQAQPGRLFKSHELCQPREFERTEFYRSFFRPLNLFHGLNAVVLREGERLTWLSLARSRALGAYTDQEAQVLNWLMPHLARALRAESAFDQSTEAAAGETAMLPRRRAEPWEARVQHRYAFTTAETRLAAILLQGKSVTEAAAALGVSLNTVRTHLKHIFEKTGVNRQSELVHLLLREEERRK